MQERLQGQPARLQSMLKALTDHICPMHQRNMNYLNNLPSSFQVLQIEGVCLLLKPSGDNQNMMRNNIELVQQEHVSCG